MELKIYQVDAFADKPFGGNPAAVVPLDEWLSDELMQNIALENNLSETAFFVKEGEKYRIRWFTPTEEVPLCGHATVASGYVLFNFIEKDKDIINFDSLSGDISVAREGEKLVLNFPANFVEPAEAPDELLKCFNVTPKEVYFGKSYVFVYDSEEDVAALTPDFNLMLKVDTFGVIATAEGSNVDFVSRFFVPSSGINEDPATGYAHTLLTPFWAKRLDKKELRGRQISQRVGEFYIEDLGEGRVKIAGNARFYLTGTITI